jgi:hypothetical protein
MPTYLPGNAGIQFSEAIAEAFASAKAGDPALRTLELRHPSFTDADGNPISIRIVNDYRNLEATDEHSQTHTYIGIPFEYVMPEQTDSGAPKAASVQLDNVSREVLRVLMQARESDDPVEIVERMFLPSDTSAPHVLPVTTAELQAPVATVESVSAQIAFGGLTNKKFPARYYAPEYFPTLAP